MRFKVEENFNKERLDRFLSINLPDRTRAFLQKLIKDGNVKLNGMITNKSGYKVKTFDEIEIIIPKLKTVRAEAEDIDLNILYEDKDIIVIDKPAKMVVHPSETGGHIKGTVVNAILYHCKGGLKSSLKGGLTGISGEIRPGIVHRLDKDTSGVLVVAKTDSAQQSLTKQFSERKIKKEYLALVRGKITPERAIIDSPIGRSAKDRKKMAITDEEKGREAVTEYKLYKVYELGDECYSLLKINLKTGRTHQIRVHMNAIGFPVVGDIVYGDQKVNKKFLERFGLDRQFLHAAKLTITHPRTGKKMTFESKLSEELERALDSLE